MKKLGGLETFRQPMVIFVFYLSLLAMKRLEIDKKEKSNRIDYFKNKQEQQKEWIEKSM